MLLSISKIYKYIRLYKSISNFKTIMIYEYIDIYLKTKSIYIECFNISIALSLHYAKNTRYIGTLSAIKFGNDRFFHK